MTENTLISRRAYPAIYNEDDLRALGEKKKSEESRPEEESKNTQEWQHRVFMKSNKKDNSIGTGLGFGNVAY